MSTKNKSVKTPLSKAYLFDQIFDEAKRLNLTIPQVKDLLAKKCNYTNETITTLIAQLQFLKKQKDLTQYPLDELACWRNAAAKRITALKSAKNMLMVDIEKQLQSFQLASTKLQKKLDSNIRWYKSLGKIISKKIDGVKFSGDII